MSEFLDNLAVLGADVDDVVARFRGNEAICEKIIRKFPADESFAKAVVAMNEGDHEQAQKMIHTLKGVSSNLGLTPIYNITVDMMDKFRAGTPEEAYARMDELKTQQELFVNEISK